VLFDTKARVTVIGLEQDAEAFWRARAPAKLQSVQN
jgi:hypothetical protein